MYSSIANNNTDGMFETHEVQRARNADAKDLSFSMRCACRSRPLSEGGEGAVD